MVMIPRMVVILHKYWDPCLKSDVRILNISDMISKVNHQIRVFTKVIWIES